MGQLSNKSLRALSLLLVAMSAFAGLWTTAAAAQTSASACPAGQPSGRPPGTPPGNPPIDTNRPQYPPGRCQLALSQSSAARGDSFRASGGGFVPGEAVTLSVAGSRVTTVAADGNGAFDTDVVVPRDVALGRTHVVAAGAAHELRADFEVVGGAAGTDAAAPATARTSGLELPRTGVELTGVAAVGTLLVAVGAVAIRATRRRRAVAA